MLAATNEADDLPKTGSPEKERRELTDFKTVNLKLWPVNITEIQP